MSRQTQVKTSPATCDNVATDVLLPYLKQRMQNYLNMLLTLCDHCPPLRIHMPNQHILHMSNQEKESQHTQHYGYNIMYHLCETQRWKIRAILMCCIHDADSAIWNWDLKR